MSAYLSIAWLYVKLFSIYMVLIGLCMMLLCVATLVLMSIPMATGIREGAILGLIIGFMFSFLLSLIGGTSQVLSVRMRHYPVTGETLNVIHDREIATGLSYSEAFMLCTESLGAVGGKVVAQDWEKGLIVARRSMGLWGMGEKISCKIEMRADNASLVHISSRPALRTAIIDHCTNLDNVERITGYLEARNA